MHNGILILLHYAFLIGKLACSQTTSYLYRLGKTWLDTKFHVANSRNKDSVHNGILILPQYLCFICKLGLKQPVIFTGLAKHGWRQNFMYLNPETKIWWIMESWFYLIMFFYWHDRFKITSYLYTLGKTWLETKFHLSKARNQVWVNNGILILPRCASFIGNSG